MDTATLVLALLAGAVAAVNPCGFALLPAYVTLAVTGDAAGDARTSGRHVALARALRFTAGMTAGFVLVFGAFALLVAPVAGGVQRWLPYLTIVLGVGLVAAGGWLLAGRDLPTLPRITLPGRLRRAGRVGGGPGGTGGHVGYGVTFALASLSCTIAPFLAVVTRSLQAGPLGAATAMVVYAVGMGAVVGVLAVSVALARAQVATALRRAAPVLPRVAGGLVLLAGAYVTWYGWYEIRVLEGRGPVDDPVVAAATGLQSALTRGIGQLGAPALAVAGAFVLVVAIVWALAARRRRAVPPEPAPARRADRSG
ncbi:MAG: cytochrome c biogenesis CcdA family protein [Kineosporiaceae bacterium]